MPYVCRECVFYDIEDQWCKERRKYYPPDDSAQYCKDFVLDKSTTSTGCFLTSACVSYMGLEDDCHELTTLRRCLKEKRERNSISRRILSDCPRYCG